MANCWDKAENADRRPAGFTPGGEVSNANVDGRVEFLLMAKESGTSLTFPMEQSFLMDPNIWIADTAATVHSHYTAQDWFDQQVSRNQ